MAVSTLTKSSDLKSIGRRKSRAVRYNQGHEALPNDNTRMDRRLENLLSRPWVQVVKKIATVPEIRRGKVLNIRCQILKGAYPVEERLARAADRVLEIVM